MILHVDMDAFYASVEIRDCPELRGQAVVVGGSAEGRGVVCAASYEARKYGVHSAMPAAQARRLCPHAVFLSPRMEHYAAVSRQIRGIFHRFTPLVEPLSLDEAFLDATGSEALFGTSVEIGRQIKRAILHELKLVASVGVAPNKFLAKLASDLEKPDGFVVVDAVRIQEFLDPLPVGRLWGVGRAAGEVLDRLRVTTIADLRRLSLASLRMHFGKHGEQLARLSEGIDDRRVIPDREAKSISHETTFAHDLRDLDVLRAWALELTEQVARRLRRNDLAGRTIQLKVRFSDFQTATRSTTLRTPTNATQEIWKAVDEMLTQRVKRTAVRLLGVGVSNLGGPSPQRTLFDSTDEASHASVDQATDRIRDKFGTRSLIRGSGLLHNAEHTPEPRPDGDPG